MAEGKYKGIRAWFVLAVLCLAVWGQTSALALEHQAHHATEHCCLLCHSGPLPFVQGAITAAPRPVLQVVWAAAAAESYDVVDVLISTSSSRAPPAQVLS